MSICEEVILSLRSNSKIIDASCFQVNLLKRVDFKVDVASGSGESTVSQMLNYNSQQYQTGNGGETKDVAIEPIWAGANP